MMGCAAEAATPTGLLPIDLASLALAVASE